MTILVTGKNGQLASELQVLAEQYPNYSFIFKDRLELDITDNKRLQSFFKDHTIHMLINCAAYTAVDNAESEVDLAEAVNYKGVLNLAKICKEAQIKLVHISTDYVFDGQNNKPYTESDVTNPKGVYGASKLAGEQAILETNLKNAIIIRTSWVYSTFGNNFVKTMLRLGKEKTELNVVDDQIGTPTFARDLAKTILELIPNINNYKPEIYHFTNEGVCSWYDFAQAIFEIKNNPIKVHPVGTEKYPTVATRPYFSVLNTSKIKENFQIEIPHWKVSLAECLQDVD